MLDLFGDTITMANISEVRARRSHANATEGFVEFWHMWPAGPRKVAKQQCIDKWARLSLSYQKLLILQHIEWMKTQPDWMKDGGAFICAPLVYLNQQRWADWTPPPKRQTDDAALRKIIADEKRAAPMPESVRKLREQLKGKA